MNSITGSYSSGDSATRCKSSAIWISEFGSGSGNSSSCRVVTMCPPLTATISPAPMCSRANSPRPAMSLLTPLRAFGEIHEETIGLRSSPNRAPTSSPVVIVC